MLNMHIKVITTDNEFDEVKDEWLSFEKKVESRNITSSYIWQRTWWKHFKNYERRNFGYNKKLCILFLYSKEDMLRAIAPFCEVNRKIKGLRYRTMEFIAQQWGATYLDIISDRLSEKEYNFLFDWLKKNKRYDLIELKYIPEFTPSFDLSKKDITVLSACPEISSDTYDSVRSNYYNKHLKKNLRRRQNKIKRERIDLATACLVSNQILDRFEEIKEVSISKGLSSKHSLYRDTWIENFVRNLVKSYSENAKCSCVEHNGKIVAYILGFEVNKKYYFWDCAYSRYEKKIKNLGLGILCQDYSIQYMLAEEIKNLCLGTGTDSDKLRFSKQTVGIYTFLKRGNSLKGKLLHIIKKRCNQKIERSFLKELKINLSKG